MSNVAIDTRREPGFAEVAEQGEGGGGFIPPLPRISIQAFCETPDVQRTLAEASSDRRAQRAQVTVQMGGIGAAIEFYEEAPTPNVIIVESMAPGASLLDNLDHLAMHCDAGTRVIVIGHANDVLLYRQLMQRGVSDYLIAPISTRDALSALGNLYAAEDAAPLGRTIAFVGAKGGVGASTIAHNIAWSISQDLRKNVVICDLDLPFGTAGLDFNQDPAQGVAEAVFSPDRLDENFIDRLHAKLSDRLSLMAAPATLDREYDFDGMAFDSLISLVRRQVPCVVLDVPHVWTAWAKQTLIAADDVVVVAAPDLANLRNAKNLIDLLTAARPNDRPPFLVLNQTGMQKRPEIQPRDFANALSVEPTAIIGFDAPLFGMASNNGQMIAEAQPKAKPAEIFRDLAEVLMGRAETRKTKKSPLQPLLDRLRRKSGDNE